MGNNTNKTRNRGGAATTTNGTSRSKRGGDENNNSEATRSSMLKYCVEMMTTTAKKSDGGDDFGEEEEELVAKTRNALHVMARSNLLSLASEMEGGIFLTEMERILAFGNTSWSEDRSGFREVYEAVRGVAVIQFVAENASTERFAKFFANSLKNLDGSLKALVKRINDDAASNKEGIVQLTLAIVKCVESIAKRSGALSEYMPGVKHEASQCFGKILRTLLGLLFVNQTKTTYETLEMAALKCIDAICAAHPGSAKQHVLSLQSTIKMYVGGGSYKRSHTFSAVAARCFASVLRASGGTKELARIWQSTMRSALVQAHHFAKIAFDGFEKLEVAEKGLKMLTPVGYELPAKFLEHTNIQDTSGEGAHDNLDSVLLVCEEMLNLKEFPVSVSVPIQSICELAKRVLKCNGTPLSQSPGLPPGVPSPRLSAKLPCTHEKALMLLNATISATKITFAPTCGFACTMLDDCLRNTVANDRPGEVTNASVRCAAYDVSINLANTLGAGAVKSFICDSIALHAIEDAAATFTNVSFIRASSARQYQSQQQRKRKKHGAHGVATEQNPEVIREIAARVDNDILLAGGMTASNRVLTSTAALKCLAAFLRVGGASISGSARRAIDDVVAAAYESSVIEPFNLYRDETCKRMLEDLKAAKTEALLASTLAPTSHRPRNSALTFASFANTCDVASVHARVALESLLHPCAPPLLERASNSLKNATREEKVKWSLTDKNNTEHALDDGSKPTWGDDGEEEEDEEGEEEDKEEEPVAMDDDDEEQELEVEDTVVQKPRLLPREGEKEEVETKRVRPPGAAGAVQEDDEFGAFGVLVNSSKLRISDDAWIPSKAPRMEDTEQEDEQQPKKKKKFGKSFASAAQKQAAAAKETEDDSDSDGALPDIVFGDDDDEDEGEDEPPASRKKPRKGKR